MIDLSMIYIVIASVLLVLIFVGLPMYRIYFRETRIERLEKFLLRQRKKPEMYIIYAMANNREEEAADMMSRLLVKYTQPHRQAQYKAAYCIYRKDAAAVKKELVHLKSSDQRHYYEAFVHTEEGNLELARDTAAKLSTPWMKSSMLSEIEKKAGNQHEAIAHGKQALHSSKGLQRYILYKTFERELPGALL